MFRIVAALLVTLGLSGAGYLLLARAGPVEIPYTDADMIATGEALYTQHCAACHGADRKGAPDWETRDTDGYYPAPPQDATGHAWHHPDVLLYRIVAEGPERVVGEGYPSRMPGFADTLSEDEILATLAFIKSKWPLVIVEAHNWVNGKPSDVEVSLEDLAACGLSLGLAEAKGTSG
jgi:mono/diheme cytochrome c family protein